MKTGDILILDNASIHAAQDTILMLKDVLDSVGVEIRKLPAYSPELNPCELVFGYVKRFLRENHNGYPLWFEIALAFSQVPHDLLEKWYDKCINKWFK